MKGELVRYVEPPLNHCPTPGWWSRLVNRIKLHDRWVCPDCNGLWEIRYEEIVGLIDMPKKVWRQLPGENA